MHEPQFLVGDATRLDLPDSSVDLVITHPPYIGVDTARYGGNPEAQINHDQKKFMKLLVKATREMERVVKDRGSIWVCVGGTTSIGFEYITEVLKKTDLKLAGWLHWDYSQSSKQERLSVDHNIWFHLHKGTDLFFNPYLVKRQHPNTWELPANNYESLVDMGLSTEGFVEDAYPEQFAQRFVEMFTLPGAVVLDPFGGTGVTAVQAWKAGRRGISVDISQDQQKLAKKRFEYSQ